MKYYLAVDIGASSGRHILSWMEDGKIQMEEIHRFSNGLIQKDGELCWDVPMLFSEIKKGMKKCKELGKLPTSIGIDTWGVDFVLLDRENQILGNTVGYRDARTKGCDELVYQKIAEDELYHRTGIQKQIFNSIYQLAAIQRKYPQYLEQAESFLMIPDYFNYLLSGEKRVEYTNATTTQLVSPKTKDWDWELIERLGYPKKIFPKIEMAGNVLGTLRQEVIEEVRYDCNVVLPATHDTGSAVVAVPSQEENTIYISSGTWSLMGVESKEADCSEESRVHNFTNEGGYQYRFRYLKNIMGLWMIQSVKKEIGQGYGFGEICEMASKETIRSLVDCNDHRFLAPANMTQEVQAACREQGVQVPKTLGETAAVIYNSLAQCYGKTIEKIEERTHRTFESIHIVGGGANADYLNRLTAKVTGRKVIAGPTEATAIGNIVVQMMIGKELADLQDARNRIADSFEMKIYQDKWR